MSQRCKKSTKVSFKDVIRRQHPQTPPSPTPSTPPSHTSPPSVMEGFSRNMSVDPGLQESKSQQSQPQSMATPAKRPGSLALESTTQPLGGALQGLGLTQQHLVQPPTNNQPQQLSQPQPHPQRPRYQQQQSMPVTRAEFTRADHNRTDYNRSNSRTEALKQRLKQEAAMFFGVHEESEKKEQAVWMGRRRRLASRKYGNLKPEFQDPTQQPRGRPRLPTTPSSLVQVTTPSPTQPDVLLSNRDEADSTSRVTEPATRQKPSVARMTLSGVALVMSALNRHRTREPSTEETSTAGIESPPMSDDEVFFNGDGAVDTLAPATAPPADFVDHPHERTRERTSRSFRRGLWRNGSILPDRISRRFRGKAISLGAAPESLSSSETIPLRLEMPPPSAKKHWSDAKKRFGISYDELESTKEFQKDSAAPDTVDGSTVESNSSQQLRIGSESSPEDNECYQASSRRVPSSGSGYPLISPTKSYPKNVFSKNYWKTAKHRILDDIVESADKEEKKSITTPDSLQDEGSFSSSCVPYDETDSIPFESPLTPDLTVRSLPEGIEDRTSLMLYEWHKKIGHHRDEEDALLGVEPPYKSMHGSWKRTSEGREECKLGPSRIDSVLNKANDNSNRRAYGMSIIHRIFGSRTLKRSVTSREPVKEQLEDLEDHRPFFTYWVTTVQILILVISIACYGLGPIGFGLTEQSGLVLVTSLSLQQVDYTEPASFWLGPRAADLIHLGAKFAPCMRKDAKILKEIDKSRERERETACCIRNDDSGCVQSSKADCSKTIATWKKWTTNDAGPGGRISGSVCGLDPKYCEAPASIAPYEWPDDITKWPICRKTSGAPLQKERLAAAEHMVCEVIGHPCCIGIHAHCKITTKEYCDFVHGHFHDEASLCSQVSCLDNVCGMMSFYYPDTPDQFYRLFTSLFLHAGILHLMVTIVIQWFWMRDLEKLTGPIRIMIIYLGSGIGGNLASAIFVPYRADVGPAGSQFGLLACYVVEVWYMWPLLKHPKWALGKLLIVTLILFLIGLLPWVDNFSHLFGFLFGLLLSCAFMPFVSFGEYDRQKKIFLIWVCIITTGFLFLLLVLFFYIIPVYDCEICNYLNCIPLTRDFCNSHNINFKRPDHIV